VPESSQHIRLVEALVNYIEVRYKPLKSMIILSDLPKTVGGDRPPRVGGYAPDVYATDAPTTITVIGEAKTAEDLVTSHSRQQIEAFLDYLRYQKSGVFVLAVPFFSSATARIVVESAKRAAGVKSSEIETVILDELTR
jgi:type IV pilus biogenesis protein CpaD/CtpE